LSADEDALAGSRAPQGARRALRAHSSIVGESLIASARSIAGKLGIGSALHAHDAGIVGEIAALVTDANSQPVVV
jgi:hypothetical protein